MADKIADITAEIEELEAQIAAKKEALETLKNTDPVYVFAENLHKTTCHNDHTEYCGWYYEIKDGKADWENGWTHKRYLEKAVALLKIAPDAKMVLDILETVRG
jgi:hypothetical protein